MSDLMGSQQQVVLSGDHVMTDSLRVAERFGKRHKNVLRDIRRAIQEAPDEKARLNFELCLEINHLQNGKPQQYYLLTKDGFMAVAMAFTGLKAAAVRWSFIRAFNEMEEFLRAQQNSSLERWNAAYLEYRHDQDHASRCGTDLCAWRNRKMVHLARLERLDPQINLPLTRAAA